MKGDFSRIRFNSGKHYTSVLHQQGRVDLDADENEQRLIDSYLQRTETVDVIGPYGAPMDDAGFKIHVDERSNEIRIGKGRYYVEGLMCENLHKESYDDQPFLIDSAYSSADLLDQLQQADSCACLCVYLEVWQRMVTALDDPCLGEPALGQADTTTRMQTVWRVVARCEETSQLGQERESVNKQYEDKETTESSKKSVAMKKSNTQEKSKTVDVSTAQKKTKKLPKNATTDYDFSGVEKLGDGRADGYPNPPTSMDSICSCEAMYATRWTPRSGKMSAQTAPGTGDCGCQPIPAAGYLGLENQLYRVEVHESGDEKTATFKWSRENGSVVVAVQSVSGCSITVNSLGPDANLGFQEGQWVELSDDTYQFGDTPNQPGLLYQIQSIDAPTLTVTMTTTVQPVNTSLNARMRRWDQVGPTATASGLALSHEWITLENGIQVCFHRGDYVSGDAWTIPARAATGQIDWPPCGGNGKAFQPPFGAIVYQAPLACITYADRTTGDPYQVEDCRRLFPSLTDLRGLADAKALHISKINWSNDDVMTLDVLVKKGLSVTFDHELKCPLTAANFVVTLETAILLEKVAAGSIRSYYAFSEQDSNTPNTQQTDTSGKTSDIFLKSKKPTPTAFRTETIIDSRIEQKAETLHWTLPYKDVSLLQDVDLIALDLALLPGLYYKWPARMRVKLPGHMLYSSGRRSPLYLDGQAFGQTAETADGSRERVDLQFPTGNSEKASDFESWFYLYPTLAVTEIDIAYTALTVDGSTGDATIVSSTPQATSNPAVQVATIYLNYPATVKTTINLTLNGDSTVASVPSTVQVAVGDSSTTVNIAINGVPTDSSTETFTLSASITSALGTAPAQTVSFTVTGQEHH